MKHLKIITLLAFALNLAACASTLDNTPDPAPGTTLHLASDPVATPTPRTTSASPTPVSSPVPVAAILTLTPAVNGKTSWSLRTDGPLKISTAGVYTIVPANDVLTSFKLWGAGGGGGDYIHGLQYPGGGGGAASGTVTLVKGATYLIRVGEGGKNSTASNGVRAGGGGGLCTAYLEGGVNYGGGGCGGGYSGIFSSTESQSTAILMAGGGGGGGGGTTDSPSDYRGGAGGGTSGTAGAQVDTSGTAAQYAGQPGTQTAGGAPGAAIYDSGLAGTALQGGDGSALAGTGGGGGYFGGGGASYTVDTLFSGGGGSGFAKASLVTDVNLFAGSYQFAGRNADADRGNAGVGGDVSAAGADGLTIISLK